MVGRSAYHMTTYRPRGTVYTCDELREVTKAEVGVLVAARLAGLTTAKQL